MLTSPRRSLRTRLIVAFLAPTVLAVGAGTVLWYYLTRQALEEELGLRLTAVAQAAAAQLPAAQVGAFGPGDETSRSYRRLARQLTRLAEATGVARLFAVSREDRSLLDTEATVPPGAELHRLAADRVELAQVFEGRATASLLFTGRDGRRYKTGYAPLRGDTGAVVAAVGADGSAAFFEVLAGFRQALIAVGLGGALLVVLTGLLVGAGITRPLGRLVEAAQAIGRGELERPVPVEGGDEIAFLGRTLEEMRGRIAERDQRMQMMLSGIAHEIRNPLGGIDLFTGLLADEVAADETQSAHVARIRKELAALTRIVNEFLEYARPSRPSRVPVVPARLFQEVLDLVEGEVQAREAEVRLEAPADGPPVDADPELLRRALLNLVLNALHALEGPDGTITLRARPTPAGRGLILEVQDSGRGIAAETLAEVFRPFYTTKAQGTGLGLALARKIIEEHEGEIEITSQEGRGTKVRIQLPPAGGGAEDL